MWEEACLNEEAYACAVIDGIGLGKAAGTEKD